MKKIVLVFVMLLVLTSCSGKEKENKIDKSSKVRENIEQVKQNKEKEMVVSGVKKVEKNDKQLGLNNIDTKTQSSALGQGNDTFTENENLAKEIEKEVKMIDEIRNSLSIYNFYFNDCKVQFKQESAIRECQRLSLKEITVGCSDDNSTNGPGKSKINDLFDLNKFDLLNKEKILSNKKVCILDRQKKQVEEEKRIKENESLNGADKELETITNNFTLSDCKKYYTKGSIEKEIKKIQEDKQIPEDFKRDIIKNLEQNFVDPVEKCEISFAVNIKKDCSILTGDKKAKCEQTVEDIKVLERMESNRTNYGTFDTNIIRQELYKKNGIEDNLPGFNGQNPETRFLPGGLN